MYFGVCFGFPRGFAFCKGRRSSQMFLLLRGNTKYVILSMQCLDSLQSVGGKDTFLAKTLPCYNDHLGLLRPKWQNESELRS